jgi:hypothetical protein
VYLRSKTRQRNLAVERRTNFFGASFFVEESWFENCTIGGKSLEYRSARTMELGEPLAIERLATKPNLTDDARVGVYQYLLSRSIDGQLRHGSLKDAAIRFNISAKTVSRIWNRGRSSANETTGASDVQSRKKGNVGRKRKEIDLQVVKDVPLHRRMNIRSLAHSIGESKSTVHRLVKSGSIKAHTNALKPFLTDANKIERLQYCMSMIVPLTIGQDEPRFKDMFDCVHVDEKWFNLTKVSARYYLLPGEIEPHRTSQSKRFITKVMFLAAVARPRWDFSRNQWFDGKLGIWPFVFQEPAKRASKNRPAGTMETKNISSVDKFQYRKMMLENVLPAIEASWPRSSRGTTIYIQQDNAKPHIDTQDQEFLRASEEMFLNVQLRFQPPNSPDTNVLDLGFFNAIQSLQYQTAAKNLDELIAAVNAAFTSMPRETLNKVFLSHQQCMIETMKVHGGNNYCLPHMNKERLQRQQALPENLTCPLELFQATHNLISNV